MFIQLYFIICLLFCKKFYIIFHFHRILNIFNNGRFQNVSNLHGKRKLNVYILNNGWWKNQRENKLRLWYKSECPMSQKFPQVFVAKQLQRIILIVS